MYSEHGLEARISPDALQVCQSFMVVLKCRPGSAEAQAAWPIFSQSSRAFSVFAIFLLVRLIRFQLPSVSTARKKSSFSDTELLEFWPEPSQLTQAFNTALRCFWLSLEPVTRAATFCSSFTFQSI